MSDFHVYVHILNEPSGSADRKLDQVLAQLNALGAQEQIIMTNLTALTAQVAETTSVEQSAITLIKGIAQQLADAGTDPTKLAELEASLKSNSDALASAVAANTPVTTEPPPTAPASAKHPKS